MDPRGKRILIFGDSLTHRGGRDAPDGVPALPGPRSSGTPGDLLATHLLTHGAAAVRINGRVSRSAVNFWRDNNGEVGADVIASEASARPDIVIFFLGTNDLGLNPAADEAAFRRLAASFPTAELWALGPPAFARADLTRSAETVYTTLRRVFGDRRVIDLRPLTPATGRTRDGVHFTSQGAAALAAAIVAALITGGLPAPVVPPQAWGVTAAGVGVAAAAVGVAWLIRRRNALREGG